MLYPSIFKNSFFNDFTGLADFPSFSGMGASGNSLMKSDIKDSGDKFEIEVDLPGFKKDDVKLQLKDGVLSIEASTENSTEEKNEEGKYLKRERFYGTCTRNFYVGDAVSQDDIKAKFDNGVLAITVPKIEKKPQIEENYFIQIEG